MVARAVRQGVPTGEFVAGANQVALTGDHHGQTGYVWIPRVHRRRARVGSIRVVDDVRVGRWQDLNPLKALHRVVVAVVTVLASLDYASALCVSEELVSNDLTWAGDHSETHLQFRAGTGH